MTKIKEIISEYTDIPVSDIDDDMSLQGDIGLDSFGLISMLNEIEEAYHVSIPDHELRKFQTLSDIGNYIHDKIA